MPSTLRIFRRRWTKLHQTWTQGQNKLDQLQRKLARVQLAYTNAQSAFAAACRDTRDAYKTQKRETLTAYRRRKRQLAGTCKVRLTAVKPGPEHETQVREIQRQWYGDGKSLDEQTHAARVQNRKDYEQRVKLLRREAKDQKRQHAKDIRQLTKLVNAETLRIEALKKQTLQQARVLLSDIDSVLSTPCEDVWLQSAQAVARSGRGTTKPEASPRALPKNPHDPGPPKKPPRKKT